MDGRPYTPEAKRMKHLTQEELENLKVGEIVEVFIEKTWEGFTRSGWVPAVVIPSTYYGAVQFYSIPIVSRDSGHLDGHSVWVGRARPDLVRRTSRVFKWSHRAKS